MKFWYTPLTFDFHLVVQMPRLPAFFINPRNGREILTLPLLDSGAAMTVINKQIAEALDIDVESGRKVECQGMGGTFYVYQHQLSVRVPGLKEQTSLKCGVTQDLETDSVLGQDGFFDSYKITFQKYKDIFEVTRKT